MNFFVLSETPTRLSFSSTDCQGNALNVQVLGGLALGHHHLVVAGREEPVFKVFQKPVPHMPPMSKNPTLIRQSLKRARSFWGAIPNPYP